MDIYSIIAVTIFIAGYLLITLEHKLHTHKAAVALALASILWVIASFSGIHHDELHHHLLEAGTEVFSILIFLLAAMTLVEILVHYNFFDLIRIRLSKLGLKDKQQFMVIGFLTFFLSAVLDNLTITIVMIQIARRFFTGKNLLVAAAGIVILANAGGAWSPIGDVTTIMIWLAKKFTAWEIISQGILPGIVIGLVSGSLLVRHMENNTKDMKESGDSIKLSRGEKVIVGVTLGSFVLPLAMHSIGLEPYMGLLLGLGVSWLLIEYIRVRSQKRTHLEANIEHMLQKTDISSLKFFTGILLAVSALKAMGVLESMSHIIFGENQEFSRVVIANIILGPLSSIVDNVPLTALSLDIISLTDPHVWVLLALSVGTGGSMLVIGSVAGVVAMGMVKELTFDKYLKYATIPAATGFIAGMATWYLQYLIIG